MKLTNKQIEYLCHTSCKSFMNEQFDRFEYYETKDGTDYSKSKAEQDKILRNILNIGKDAVNRGNLNDKNAVKQMLDVLESKNKLIQK